MIRDLVQAARTVRRYREDKVLGADLLEQLVDLARIGGSARNAQTLKYMVVAEPGLRQAIFSHLAWAGYLSDWPGPALGERPAAYIVCLLDLQLLKGPEAEAHFDLGIATQSMLLGAAEQGVMGCRIGAFSAKLKETLRLPERYKPLLVLALGYPAEEVLLEEVGPEGNIRYWRDGQGRHHVPKRSLAELLVPAPEAA